MIVRFVDIGGIDDYHRLNFLFINWFIIWLPLLKFLNLLPNVVYFFVSITCRAVENHWTVGQNID
jgi:hypothetical protein